MRVVVLGTHRPDFGNDLKNGVEGYAAKTGCGTNGIAFHESGNDPGAVSRAQAVHAIHYA
jgi:hypothetical protein